MNSWIIAIVMVSVGTPVMLWAIYMDLRINHRVKRDKCVECGSRNRAYCGHNDYLQELKKIFGEDSNVEMVTEDL